MKIITIIIIII